MKLLCEYGAHPNPMERDGEKLTPLDYAMIGDGQGNYHEDIVQYLSSTQGALSIVDLRELAATYIQAWYRNSHGRKGMVSSKSRAKPKRVKPAKTTSGPKLSKTVTAAVKNKAAMSQPVVKEARRPAKQPIKSSKAASKTTSKVKSKPTSSNEKATSRPKPQEQQDFAAVWSLCLSVLMCFVALGPFFNCSKVSRYGTQSFVRNQNQSRSCHDHSAGMAKV